jgi:hypothetical protein
MIIKELFRRPGSLKHLNCVLGCVVAATIVLGGYAVLSGGAALKQAWTSERALRDRKAESMKLSAEAKRLRGWELLDTGRRPTGVEAFAVQMVSWAKERGVRIESLSPEGVETSETVVFENAPIGQWTIEQVSVRGQGQFERVMDVMEELCADTSPVSVKSFSLQALDGGRTGAVEFQVTVAVYRRKSGEA